MSTHFLTHNHIDSPFKLEFTWVVKRQPLDIPAISYGSRTLERAETARLEKTSSAGAAEMANVKL